MVNLDGRVAIVTGAGGGIGSETARRLAGAGARVILTDLDKASVMREAAAIGRQALAVGHDVTNLRDWVRVVETATGAFGGLDILVNNAGTFGPRRLERLSEDDYHRMTGVSADGMFLGLKACVPAMADPDRRLRCTASIVNLGSVAGLVGFANSIAYSAAKGAVRMMSKSASIELAPLGIRVNAVHPGFIETKLAADGLEQLKSDGIANDLDAVKEDIRAAHPIGRLGRPQDVASAILFLASDEASFITGADLAVDGGFTAQ